MSAYKVRPAAAEWPIDLTDDRPDARFIIETAKPSARESAGGFAFVPPYVSLGATSLR
jgi:hypothetical protein